MPSIDDTCPVCAEATTAPTVRTPGFIEISCRMCGRFRIATQSLAAVRRSTAPERRNHLLKAILGADKGSLPLIGKPDCGGSS